MMRLTLCALALAGASAYAQMMPAGPDQKDMAVSKSDNSAVVEALAKELEAHYVFPEMGARLSKQLREQNRHGDYAAITSAKQLTEKLNANLQQAAHDKHLAVFYSAETLPPAAPGAQSSMQDAAAERAELAKMNFGIARVERLPFNIGYLDLAMFAPPRAGADALAAAMTLVANTDALIIDLRHNGGGEPETVGLLASYLLDGRTRLNDQYYRDGDRLEQMWTLSQVPGQRFGQSKPLYLLTSHDTFSAAEDFAYAMKNLKRATIIGETTGGGAHPGDFLRLQDHFQVFMPNGRSISPVTKTDWEGTGVTPDIAAAAPGAFELAQSVVLKAMMAKESNPGRAKRLQARIKELGASN